MWALLIIIYFILVWVCHYILRIWYLYLFLILHFILPLWILLISVHLLIVLETLWVLMLFGELIRKRISNILLKLIHYIFAKAICCSQFASLYDASLYCSFLVAGSCLLWCRFLCLGRVCINSSKMHVGPLTIVDFLSNDNPKLKTFWKLLLWLLVLSFCRVASLYTLALTLILHHLTAIIIS